jgi:hypothetical protein
MNHYNKGYNPLTIEDLLVDGAELVVDDAEMEGGALETAQDEFDIQESNLRLKKKRRADRETKKMAKRDHEELL